VGEANKILDAIARAVNYTAPTAFWVKLHIGDPGAAGTANPAVNTTRKQATFGSGAASGLISNTVALTWTTGEVTGTEDYTHWSGWTLSSGGTFLCSGLMTANAVVIADEFTIPIGDLDLSLGVAA
jgi:hypothetical protein